MGGMELKQNLKLVQQLVMTPRLQLAIKMLGLNNIELSEMIKQEISENPIIDMDGAAEPGTGVVQEVFPGGMKELNEDPGFSEPGSDPNADSFLENMIGYLANYDEQLDDLSRYGNEGASHNKDFLIENSTFVQKTLYDSIMEQVMTGDFLPAEIELARYIAGNLDSHGFLAVSMDELKEFANSSVLDSGSAEELTGSVLQKFHRLEPVGLGAKDSTSSLLIQADYYFAGDALLKTIITEHLRDVANQNYQKISRLTGEEEDRVHEAIRRLKKLNPYPAGGFGQSDSRFVTPDLFLKKEGGKYVVFMDDNHLPQIKISSYYRNIINGEVESTPEMKNYVQERFKSALWLMKSISTRKETIVKIAQLIVDTQRDFFDMGPGHLKPLILKDIAAELNIHESTVSRATSNKYIFTHAGVFELKDFFSGASYGDSSSESVMARIKKIIDLESSSGKVYRDNDIMAILKAEGIIIARRTIAKYRELMNIPPSSRRKL